MLPFIFIYKEIRMLYNLVLDNDIEGIKQYIETIDLNDSKVKRDIENSLRLTISKKLYNIYRLLARIPNIDLMGEDNFPLLEAIYSENTLIIDDLFSRVGSKLLEKDRLPFHLSMYLYKPEITQQLIDKYNTYNDNRLSDKGRLMQTAVNHGFYDLAREFGKNEAEYKQFRNFYETEYLKLNKN